MKAIECQPDMVVSAVLTRRPLSDFPLSELHTQSVDELLNKSQVIIECAGDPIYGTEVVARALEASLPVITMDAELQVTAGTYLSTLGVFTEAEGDQPGALGCAKT